MGPMNLILSVVVFLMIAPVLAVFDDWEKFNSSLVIEVRRPNGVFTCTGVAVSSKVIVTAGHCLEGSVLSVRVFTGARYNTADPTLEVKDYRVHPDYNPRTSRYFCDLAKINLRNKIPRSIRIHPIYLGSKLSGEIYRFGFGERSGRTVRTVITPTLKNMNAADEVLELYDDFSRSGDSGGPVFLRNGEDVQVIAIHSTFSYGPAGNFSLNPLLRTHISWIYEN
jgi:hypothetical protein